MNWDILFVNRIEREREREEDLCRVLDHPSFKGGLV